MRTEAADHADGHPEPPTIRSDLSHLFNGRKEDGSVEVRQGKSPFLEKQRRVWRKTFRPTY